MHTLRITKEAGVKCHLKVQEFPTLYLASKVSCLFFVHQAGI